MICPKTLLDEKECSLRGLSSDAPSPECIDPSYQGGSHSHATLSEDMLKCQRTCSCIKEEEKAFPIAQPFIHPTIPLPHTPTSSLS